MLLVVLACMLACFHQPSSAFSLFNFKSKRSFRKNGKVAAGSIISNHAQLIFDERDLDSDEIISTTVMDNNGRLMQQSPLMSTNTNSPILSFLFYTKNSFKSVFLPTGYPHSIPIEYTVYQKWNLLQDFCSFLRGIMSTQSILKGMGVGRSDITSLQATVQWILRDGASMLGGLVFTSFSSANFGQNIKSWRLFADLINNIGITLDIIAPLYPEKFLVIVCIASICKVKNKLIFLCLMYMLVLIWVYVFCKHIFLKEHLLYTNITVLVMFLCIVAYLYFIYFYI